MNENQGKVPSNNKPFLAGVIILIAAFCTAGAWIKQAQKQVQAGQDQLTRLQQEEAAQLNSQLNEANAHYLAEANRVNAANADVHDPLDPKYLVQQLRNISNSTEEYERNSTAFYCLEGLLMNGTNSLPALKDIIIEEHNFDLNLNRLYPNRSLRQEIMTLLMSMKTRDAADLLSRLIPAVQNAKEMRDLSRELMSISDGYRPYCISAAREMHAKALEKRNEIGDWNKQQELDRQMEEILRQNDNKVTDEFKSLAKIKENIQNNERETDSLRSTLIEILKDDEFTRSLMDQKAWRRNEGNVDTSLFTISESVLHDAVMPYCYEAIQYQEENHKNKKAAPALMSLAQKYIGQPQATEIILKTIKEKTSSADRCNSILNLSLDKRFPKNINRINFDAYKIMPAAGTELVDAETARMANERLIFLDAAAAQFADDENMQRVIAVVRSNLQYIASEGADMNVWTPDESIKNELNKISENIIDKGIDEHLEEFQKQIEKEIERTQKQK